jgi:hypothetical protein
VDAVDAGAGGTPIVAAGAGFWDRALGVLDPKLVERYLQRDRKKLDEEQTARVVGA